MSAPDAPLDPRVERSRAAALDAAADILREEGWDAVTQVRVAERAGIGRATVYRHWPKTADLLRDTMIGLAPVLEVPDTGDLRADLRGFLQRIRAELHRGYRPVLATLIDRAEWEPDVRAVKLDVTRIATQVLRERLDAAVRAGQLAPGDLDRMIDQLLGPLLFRILLTEVPTGPAFLDGIVDDALRLRAP